MHQRHHRLLDIEPFQTRLAHRQVVPDRVTGSSIEFVVEKFIDALEHMLAVVERRVVRTFDVHVLLASVRLTPLSRA